MSKKKRVKQAAIEKTREIGQTYCEEKMAHPHLKAVILEVIEEQLRLDDPPETRQAYEHLLVAGHTHKQAVEMIGATLVEEIWEMLHEGKRFDRTRFTALLEQLS